MKKITLIATGLLSLLAFVSQAEEKPTKKFKSSDPIQSIPQPPVGKRWILNEQFSDEFNGTKLDDTKWLDHHDSWKGREPGMFDPKQVSVKDGCLVLKGEKMAKDTIVKAFNSEYNFNVSCAAVVSKTQEAHYGYYECRFKANQTTLSTTFWMSSRGGKGTYSTEDRQPLGTEKGKFSQELDICECIGRTGDFGGKFMADGMNSNIHYWFTPEDGSPKKDIRIKETRLRRPDAAKPTKDFNVYGCWWKDAENATFYLNNETSADRTTIGRESWKAPYDKHFRLTEPMGLNMVVETYPFPWVPLPTDEELADPKKNASYYDWVRSYILVDATENVKLSEPTIMFDEHIHFLAKPKKVNVEKKKVEFQIAYTANQDRDLYIVIYDENGKEISKELYSVYAGYANMNFSTAAPKGSKTYYAVAYICKKGEKNLDKAFESDAFDFSL